MRDLLTDPAWRTEDLGQPLPDSVHAVSVALPTWDHVIRYEENDPALKGSLRAGYPRFFCHPLVMRLFEQVKARVGRSGEACLVYPTESVARRCAEYVERETGDTGRIVPVGTGDLHAVLVPEARGEKAFEYWRFSGEVLSSRQADSVLRGTRPPDAAEPKRVIRERLARIAGQRPEDVYLFPSGMAAVMAAQRIVTELRPERETIQFEFPYVDSFRVQRAFGCGAHMVAVPAESDYTSLAAEVKADRVCAVYTEVASNPLIRTPDLERLASILSPARVPFFIDDTVGTSVNVDVFRFADLVTTSLTKFFGGKGDVLAGSLIINGSSPLAGAFRDLLAEDHEDLLWDEDALLLEEESRGYEPRVRAINTGAMRVVEFLERDDRVASVWHPSITTRGHYDQARRGDGGFSGLLSIVLREPERTSAPFYDALRVSKGPSLGTEFSLACPFTLLAHYDELERVEAMGVSRYLVRVSVGLEDPEELIARFDEALTLAQRR